MAFIHVFCFNMRGYMKTKDTSNRTGTSADCRKRAPTLGLSLIIQETNSLEAKTKETFTMI